MTTLNVSTYIEAYEDAAGTNAPCLSDPRWNRKLTLTTVQRSSSLRPSLAPGEELTFFNGERTLTQAADTAYNLALLASSNLYRLSYVGGTDPSFRVARALSLNGVPLTIVANANGTLTVSAGSAVFGAVLEGDTVSVRGTTTGDPAGPFNLLNEGDWTALAVTSNTLVLARPPGVDVDGVSQSVTPTDDAQVLAYSSSGVQVGDYLKLTGFGTATDRTYVVSSVTSKSVEFTSANPLPNLAGVTPGATALTVYTSAKSFVYTEFNQDVELTINGGTPIAQRPWAPSDPFMVGQFQATGPIWSLKVRNASLTAANVFVLSLE